MGLAWSAMTPLAAAPHCAPALPGIYKILDAATDLLLYIGEASNIASRLRQHARRSWAPYAPVIAWNADPALAMPHHRHERESDLLGAYYFANGNPPYFQYGSASD